MRQEQTPHGCHIGTEKSKAHNICVVNPNREDHIEAQTLIAAYKTDCLQAVIRVMIPGNCGAPDCTVRFHQSLMM